MKGYKAFNSDWTCRGFQYEVGKTYEMSGDISVCYRGFHFCTSLEDCFDYYDFGPNTKIAEVEALGDIKQKVFGSKCCTNKIKIIKEITFDKVIDIVNHGYLNTGIGNRGSFNTGNNNVGDRNTGYLNKGLKNTGCYNRGDSNSGDLNVGGSNSGNENTGSCNSGDYNVGYGNSGNHNIGNFNSGSWNKGTCLTGCFNTNGNQTIPMFNKPSNWTMDKLRDLGILVILEGMPDSKESRQEWWDYLRSDDKDLIKSLPNFDPEIFKEITGIQV